MAALISDEFEKLKERVAEALGIPRRMLDDDYEFSSESPLKLTGGEVPDTEPDSPKPDLLAVTRQFFR